MPGDSAQAQAGRCLWYPGNDPSREHAKTMEDAMPVSIKEAYDHFMYMHEWSLKMAEKEKNIPYPNGEQLYKHGAHCFEMCANYLDRNCMTPEQQMSIGADAPPPVDHGLSLDAEARRDRNMALNTAKAMEMITATLFREPK
jgi:hypothetical protein